jgi:AcrR family transcriptional regulator
MVTEESGNRNSRKLVADAAAAEFAEFGYAGARTERIAKRAGVNKQLIFYYFGSKAGLYEGVLGTAGQELQAALAAAARPAVSPPEALRAMLSAVFGTLELSPDLARLVARSAFEGGSNGAGRPIRDLSREFSRVISKGQGLGHFRDEVDPARAARQAVVLLVGYLALENIIAEGPAETRRAQWIESVADTLIRSLSW